MFKNSEKSYKTANSPKEYGVILGCWDHEKTPIIIKELEDSVNLVDKKCKKLMQHLIYYKQYWEEFSRNEDLINFLTIMKNRRKPFKTSDLKSNSAPNICFGKNKFNNLELEKLFQNMCKRKLTSINKALSNASKKIGLKENIILLPNNHCSRGTEKQTVGDVKKSWSKIEYEFLTDCVGSTVKSDTCIHDIKKSRTCSNISKITKNEWELYQRVSRIRFPKRLNKKCLRKLNKKKVVFSPRGKANLKFNKINAKNYVLENLAKHKSKGQNNFNKTTCSKASINEKKLNSIKKENKDFGLNNEKMENQFTSKATENFKKDKNHSISAQSLQQRSSKASHDTTNLNPDKFEKKDSEIELICNNILETIHKKNQLTQSNSVPRNVTDSNLRTTCSSYVKQVMPFTSCCSTSRSFNVWMNLQHFLSLKKYGRKSDLKNIYSSKNLDFENKNSEKVDTHNEMSEFKESLPKENFSLNSRYITNTYPWNYEETNCNYEREQINHVERNKKIWIADRSNVSSDRKFRSMYTKTTPETFLEYHKSTTKQYTNGQESLIRSESKTAYAVGSKIMVSDCQRTNFYGIKKETLYNNASGDSTLEEDNANMKIEWDRVYSCLSALYRKYSALKIEAEKNDSNPSNAAIISLETEIDNAIEKYKEFLKIYSKFLQLKNRLKSMKIACETTSFATTAPDYTRRANIKRITYSMILKETFKRVQNLQEQIKQINNF